MTKILEMRAKRAKLWEEGRLVRDYVPCVSNGVACLYDRVSRTFAKSQTSAAFEPGETEHIIKMRSPAELTARPKGLVVRETDSLGVGWKSVMPTLMSSESQGDGTWLNTFTVPKDYGAFFKLALDTE